MNKKKILQVLSISLALIMILSLTPLSALASGNALDPDYRLSTLSDSAEADSVVKYESDSGIVSYYSDLGEAFTQASQQNEKITLTLLGDLDLGSCEEFCELRTGEIVLDLGGFTLSCTARNYIFIIRDTAVFTVKNGKLFNTYFSTSSLYVRATAITMYEGSLILENVALKGGVRYNDIQCNSFSYTGGNLEVRNCDFTGTFGVFTYVYNSPSIKIYSATLHDGICFEESAGNGEAINYDSFKNIFADGCLLLDANKKEIELTSADHWQTEDKSPPFSPSLPAPILLHRFSYDSECSVKEHRKHTLDGNNVCTICGFHDFTLTVDGGEVVEKEVSAGHTSDYYLATVTADMQKGDKYFVYWRDADTGEIVSTYRTYKFFLVKNTHLEAVYATQQNYTAERNKGVTTARVVSLNAYELYDTYGYYKLYTEHSIAKSVGSITGHGVIYTLNGDLSNLLTLNSDNEEIITKSAESSAASLTGTLEVSLELNTEDTPVIWARPYIVGADGNVIYGKVTALTVPTNTAAGQSGEGELVTLGTTNYDLTELNVDEPPVEFDEPTENVFLSFINSLLSKLVEFLDKIVSFIMNSEVIK